MSERLREIFEQHAFAESSVVDEVYAYIKSLEKEIQTLRPCAEDCKCRRIKEANAIRDEREKPK